MKKWAKNGIIKSEYTTDGSLLNFKFLLKYWLFRLGYFEFVFGRSGEQLLNISGIADVIYVLLTANYIGRRYALSIAHLFIGVSCVSMAFIPKEYSNTILALYLVSTVFAGASKYQLTLLRLMRGYFYSLVIF